MPGRPDFAVLVLCTLLTGACGRAEPPTPPPAGPAAPEPAVPEAGLDARVTYEGPERDVERIAIPAVAGCEQGGPAGTLLRAEDGGLAGVFVRVPGAPPAGPAAREPATMAAQGCRYRPRKLVVAPGAPLRFENRDPVLHTFHLRRLDGGELRSVQNVAVPPATPPVEVALAEPGLYRVTSDGMPDLDGWVLVAPPGTGAITDEAGRAALPLLPPGEYEVELHHERLGARTEGVSVPSDGPAALRVRFD